MNNYHLWYVCIVKDQGNVPQRVMGPFKPSLADRIADGAGRNLNRDEYSIVHVREDSIDPDWKRMAVA